MDIDDFHLMKVSIEWPVVPLLNSINHCFHIVFCKTYFAAEAKLVEMFMLLEFNSSLLVHFIFIHTYS